MNGYVRQGLEFFSNVVARLIGSDDADDIDKSSQSRDIARNIARAAQTRGFALRMQNGNGGFGRYAFDHPINVTVEHQVADAQDAAVDKFIKARGECRH
jgi:hypothetical protein